MSIYWSEGRYYFAPNAGLGVRTGRNERCLVRVGSDFLSDPNLTARRNPFCISAYFSNSRGRALVSARHREIVRRTNPFAPCTVSDGQGYSAAKCNSASGRTI